MAGDCKDVVECHTRAPQQRQEDSEGVVWVRPILDGEANKNN